MGAEEFHWGIIRWEYWRGRECLAHLFCLSSESLTEISESKVMSTKQNHKNGDGDKHLGALGHSQEKIGESPLISPDLFWSLLISTDLYWSLSLWGGPGLVRPHAHRHLHRPHFPHLPSLTVLRDQGRPGQLNWIIGILRIENSGERRTVVKPIENIGPDFSR